MMLSLIEIDQSAIFEPIWFKDIAVSRPSIDKDLTKVGYTVSGRSTIGFAMRNSLTDDVLLEQSISNLRFMIQLHLQVLAVARDGSDEAERTHADLRRMMEMEDALRARCGTHAAQAMAVA